MNYKVIKATSLNNLEWVVTSMCPDGWKPHGNLVVDREWVDHFDNRGNPIRVEVPVYLQPMVKPASQASRPATQTDHNDGAA